MHKEKKFFLICAALNLAVLSWIGYESHQKLEELADIKRQNRLHLASEPYFQEMIFQTTRSKISQDMVIEQSLESIVSG